MQTQEKSFLLLLLNNFPEKKSKTLLFKALIKREILTSREALYTKLVRARNQSLFSKKDAFKNMGFSFLKSQRKRKKIDSAFF